MLCSLTANKASKNPTDFAVTNGGGIRANIEPGKVTLGDVIAVMPFGNSISQISVTGSQVKDMFELSLRSMAQKDENGAIILDDYKQPKLGANGGFLHVSSTIRVHYDSTKKVLYCQQTKGMGQIKPLLENEYCKLKFKTARPENSRQSMKKQPIIWQQMIS